MGSDLQTVSTLQPGVEGRISGDRSGLYITAEGIDRSARICFPLSFALFNIAYWIYYTRPVVYSGMDE